MTLAKATVSGTVYREPQDRSTTNGVVIWDFVLNIDETNETLMRVISKRKAHADLLANVKKGNKLLVDGRLQIFSSKSTDGTERKYFEIDANDIEVLSTSTNNAPSNTADSFPVSDVTPVTQEKELVTFAEEDFSEDTLIDEGEIPF